MRVETKMINLYKFSELSEKAQEKAIDAVYDLGVHHDWYETVYDDAARIGLTITEFDCDRGNKIEGNLTVDVPELAKRILQEHGNECETFKLAETFFDSHEKIVDDDCAEMDNLCLEFERAIKEEYLSMLRKEYEYLFSREHLTELIEINGWEFTEDGKLY